MSSSQAQTNEVSSKIYYLATLLLAALYSLNHFSGVDVFAGYYGMAFKLIHPDSFVGDEYVTSNQTYMISLYSLVVKLFGDLWLDDRFVLVIYTFLTFGILILIGKIAERLGVKTIVGKLAVMALLAAEHPIISNVPQLMESGSFRPTSMSYPFAWLLIYFLISGASWFRVGVATLLMLGMSIKNCWHPAALMGLLFASEYLGFSKKKIWGLSLLGFGFLLGGLYFLSSRSGSLQDNLEIWRLSLGPNGYLEGSEASPYQDGFGPVVFLVFLLWAYLTPNANDFFRPRLKFILGASTAIYFIGAQYYQFAPDPLKFPILVALAVSRSTWWTQLVAFTVVSTFVVGKLETSKKWPAWIKYGILSLIVLLFPFFQFYWFKSFFKPYHLRNFGVERLSILFGVSIFITLLFWWLVRKLEYFKKVNADLTGKQVVVLSAVFLSLNLYLANMAYRNRGNLFFLARNGVMGGWAPARWVEVNQYFREQTPKDATVISFGVDPNEPTKMDVDYALKVRTGKTMPIHSEIGVYMNWPKRKHLSEVSEAMSFLALSFNQCDLRKVPEQLAVVKNPDYIVMPTHLICFDIAKLTPYKEEVKIGGFTILKREKGS